MSIIEGYKCFRFGYLVQTLFSHVNKLFAHLCTYHLKIENYIEHTCIAYFNFIWGEKSEWVTLAIFVPEDAVSIQMDNTCKSSAFIYE